MSIEAKNFRGGGMDSDSDFSDIAVQDYIQAFNFRNTGTQESEEGDETNIESTNPIAMTLPAGLNKCIGAEGFEVVRKAYALMYNSQGLNQIHEFDYDTQTLTVLFENKTNSGGVDIMPLDPQYYVHKDIKLIQDRFLLWTDNYGHPYYADLTALKNGSLGNLIEEDLSLVKGQPITQPTYVYNNDAGRSKNDLKNRLFQFRTSTEKQNFETTLWSTISKRVVPTNENTPAIGTDVTIANNLIVSVDAGGIRDKKINVAARYDLLDWFLERSVERSYILALPNTTVDVSSQIYEAYDPATNIYSFAFYNDGSYTNIPVLETDENYDHTPLKAGTIEDINDGLIALADITEGYNRPTVDVTVSVSSYNPNISTPPTISNPLSGYIAEHYRISNRSYYRVVLNFNGQPKTGDKIFIQTKSQVDGGAAPVNYSITVLSTENNNLQAVLNRLATIIPNSAVGTGIFVFETQGYNRYDISQLSFALSNAGTGASTSIHSIKTNSSYQLALAHYDKSGRYFPLVTDNRFIVKTESYAITHGLIPQINWSLNNSLPPKDATTYQWLISLNNTHATSLYINGAYSSEKSDADYIVFDISSLKRFNDVNSSSVINYDYSPGDRVTLLFTFSGVNTPIKWFDSPAIDVEVAGFDIDVDTSVTPNITHYYLKVRKSPSLNVADINGLGTLMEIYTPKKRTVDTKSALFYEIGERFDIVNGAYSVKQGVITEADCYFKTRNLTGVLNPNIPYVFQVEDFNFSDFYKSDYYSYGRPRTYDDEQERTNKGASIRYSDTFIKGSRVNGLNRFYGARIYGEGAGESSSSYGRIIKIRMRDNYVICIHEIKVGHIPVNRTILESLEEQRNVAISDKLFNTITYLPGKWGMGTNKESFAESQNGTVYFADPNNSLPVRDGYDGLKVIAGKMTKYFRRVLKQAKANGLKIIGYYDTFYDEYNLSIENKNGVLTYFSFNNSDWKFDEGYVLTEDTDFTIVSDTNGTVVNNGDGTATFTPDNDYVGNAGFVFEFTQDGNLIQKNVCINVLAGTTTISPFYFVDLTNQPTSTIIESNSVLISGNNIPVAISIVGGEYQINGGTWVSIAGTVSSGDIVKVRLTTSGSINTSTSATLTVSGYSDSFDVETGNTAIEFYYSTNFGNNPFTEGSFDLEKNDVLIIQQSSKDETNSDFNGVFTQGDKIKFIHTSVPASFPWETLSGSRMRIVKNGTTEIFNNLIGTQANPLQSFTQITDGTFNRIDLYVTAESTKIGVATRNIRPYIFLNPANKFSIQLIDTTTSAIKLEAVPAINGDRFRFNFVADANTMTLNVTNTTSGTAYIYVEGTGFTFSSAVGGTSTVSVPNIPKDEIYLFDVEAIGYIHRADFTKNSCTGGLTGTSVPFAKGYVDMAASTADNANFNTEGQARANALGNCI